jgi:hypothetical protein
MVFAARLTPRLRRSLRRLDDGTRPIAEVNRLLGAEAQRSGHFRPSYEQVRQAVHAARLDRAPERARIVVELRVLPSGGVLSRLLRRLGLRRNDAAEFVTACHVLIRGPARARPPTAEPAAPRAAQRSSRT